eukprot:5676-Heterococcus_DN1.PRE.2
MACPMLTPSASVLAPPLAALNCSGPLTILAKSVPMIAPMHCRSEQFAAAMQCSNCQFNAQTISSSIIISASAARSGTPALAFEREDSLSTVAGASWLGATVFLILCIIVLILNETALQARRELCSRSSRDNTIFVKSKFNCEVSASSTELFAA